MRQLPTPRPIPKSARYFEVHLPGRSVHHFRLLRSSATAALAQRFLQVGVLIVDGQVVPNPEPSEEAEQLIGEMIGRCWWHRSMDLEVQRQSFTPGRAGGAAYGEAVIEELSEAGYTDAEVGQLGGALAARMVGASLPPEEEVAERAAGFPG